MDDLPLDAITRLVDRLREVADGTDGSVRSDVDALIEMVDPLAEALVALAAGIERNARALISHVEARHDVPGAGREASPAEVADTLERLAEQVRRL